MASQFLSHLADVSLRAVLLAALAALFLWAFRTRANHAFSHAVWTSVLIGMLALFFVTPFLPVPAIPEVPWAIRQIAVLDQLPNMAAARTTVSVRPGLEWAQIALFVYLLPVLGLLARLVTGVWLTRKVALRAILIRDAIYETPAVAVPVTAGTLRPRILLPLAWREWDQQTMDAIVAHESAHIRRLDPVVTLLAAVNRSIFWFHPLAWWLERKLALLAEHSCDDASLCAIGDRQAYAQLLLNLSRDLTGSGGRFLAMATPARLPLRLAQILDEKRQPSPGLARRCVATIAAIALPILLTVSGLRLVAQRPALNNIRLLTVHVTDPLHRFVTGLEQDHFEIKENGLVRPITKFSNVDSPIAMAVVTDADAPDLIRLKDPGDELIQSASFDEALRKLTASKLERKVMVISKGASTSRILPGGILYMNVETAMISKTLVELRNQYVITFSSAVRTGTLEVVLKQPRGLPVLKTGWYETRGVDGLLKIAQ